MVYMSLLFFYKIQERFVKINKNFISLKKEGNKEFVKYQEPNERYVPIKDLPIVCEYLVYPPINF